MARSGRSVIERKKTVSLLSRERALSFLFILSLTACGGGGSDELAPRVVRTDPAPQAKNVPTSAPVRATFSYPVDPVSINENTFIVSGGAGISGTVTYENDTAIFTPAAPWAESTTYNAVLTTGVRDLDGIPLPSNFAWTFETAGPDTTPPTVAATTPADGASDVARSTPIMATFSEPVKPETINAETFFVSGGVTGEVEYDPSTHTAKFIPVPMLSRNVRYQVTVTTGVQDLSGNPLASNKTWTFNTGISTDPVSPVPSPVEPQEPANPPVTPAKPALVASTYPCDGMVNVRVNIPSIWAKFREPLDGPTVVGKLSVRREEGGSNLFGVRRYEEDEGRIYFERFSRLSYDTWYVAALGEGIRSSSGETMPPYSWRFKTQPNPVTLPFFDSTPPGVQCTYPPSGSTHPVTSTVRAYLNEPVEPRTVNSGTFIVKQLGDLEKGGRDDDDDEGLRGDYEVDSDLTVIFDPRDRFKSGTTYEVTLTTGITDRSGNPLPSNFVWRFTTAP